MLKKTLAVKPTMYRKKITELAGQKGVKKKCEALRGVSLCAHRSLSMQGRLNHGAFKGTRSERE